MDLNVVHTFKYLFHMFLQLPTYYLLTLRYQAPEVRVWRGTEDEPGVLRVRTQGPAPPQTGRPRRRMYSNQQFPVLLRGRFVPLFNNLLR